MAATVVGSLGTACSDVVVDSIVVERSRGQPQAHSNPVSKAKAVAGGLQCITCADGC